MKESESYTLDIIAVLVFIIDICYSIKAYMDHAYIYLTGDIICALLLLFIFGGKYIKKLTAKKTL